MTNVKIVNNSTMEIQENLHKADICDNCNDTIFDGMLFFADGYGYVCSTCQSRIARIKYNNMIDND